MSGLSLRPDGTLSPVVAQCLDAADGVEGFGTNIAATLAWCCEVGSRVAADGSDSPRDTWDLLAGTALLDVSAARILEPHVDALSIIAEAEAQTPGDGGAVDHTGDLSAIGVTANAAWGVFAAEGAGLRLEAHEVDCGWTLTGTKPWCSLAAHLSHALVTAWVNERERRLFAVDLRSDAVHAHPGPWHARGLSDIVSAPVDFVDVMAIPIGEAEWYTTRPGFARGGIGVAACWWGGAMGLIPALAAAASREGSDQIARAHWGRVDAALWAARAVLNEAADAVQDPPSSRDLGLVASRVRSCVATAAEGALHESALALGPLPLVADEEHARRVADLGLYLRQHHGDRDAARLGRQLAESRLSLALEETEHERKLHE